MSSRWGILASTPRTSLAVHVLLAILATECLANVSSVSSESSPAPVESAWLELDESSHLPTASDVTYQGSDAAHIFYYAWFGTPAMDNKWQVRWIPFGFISLVKVEIRPHLLLQRCVNGTSNQMLTNLMPLRSTGTTRCFLTGTLRLDRYQLNLTLQQRGVLD